MIIIIVSIQIYFCHGSYLIIKSSSFLLIYNNKTHSRRKNFSSYIKLKFYTYTKKTVENSFFI